MSTQGKIISCRAAVNWEPGTEAKIETVQVAPPKAGEIRVKMTATGICFSDVSLGKGTFPDLPFPIILGHEGAGVVESVGQGVTSFKSGDHVIPVWSVHCSQCRLCRRGKRNRCQVTGIMQSGTLLDKTTRITCQGKAIKQAMGLGLFSEYVVLPAIGATKVKTCPSMVNLASFGCAVPTGYGAARYTANVDEGAVVAVWGLGAIGLCVAMGCKEAKAARIIGIDINPDKFDLGKKFGCTEFLNPSTTEKPVPEVLREMCGGLGLDYAFVCVGSTDTMADALESCSVGASECVIIGLGAAGATFPVNHTDLVMGKSVKGSSCGDCWAVKHIPELVEKYIAGEFPTDDLVTHTLPLDKINTGYDLLIDGKAFDARLPADRMYGVRLPNGTWTGIIGSFQRGEALLTPFLATSYQRSEIVTYSTPYYLTYMVLFGSAPPAAEKNVSGLVLILDWEVWLGLFLSYLTLSFLTSLELKKTKNDVSIRLVSSGKIFQILFDFLSIFLFEATFRDPRVMFHRILQGVWWLLVLVLMNGFCGNMRASMMQNEKPDLLRGLGDLAEQRKFLPLIVRGSAYDDFMGRVDNPPDYKNIYRRCLEGGGYRSLRRMYSKETFSSLVKREGIYIGEESTFKQFLGSFCRGTSAAESRLYVSKETVFPHCFSIGMSKAMDKNLMENINLIISRVQQSAIMNLWLAEEFMGWTRCTIEESVATEEPLKFKNLSGIFYLFLGCLAIATISFFCEFPMICCEKKCCKARKKEAMIEDCEA